MIQPIPAEWAPHRAMWIGWPSHGEVWLDYLDAARDEVEALVRALGGPEERVEQALEPRLQHQLFVDLLAQRFALARKRLGLERRDFALDCSQFAPPGRQLALL